MTDTTLQALEIAGIIERTCYERGGDIQAADDAAKQILEALTPEVSDEMVERVGAAIERHFQEMFGATVERDVPSHLVRLLEPTGFNPFNVARAAIEAMRPAS